MNIHNFFFKKDLFDIFKRKKSKTAAKKTSEVVATANVKSKNNKFNPGNDDRNTARIERIKYSMSKRARKGTTNTAEYKELQKELRVRLAIAGD